MRRGRAAFSSDGLSAGHTSCHKMQGLSCSFLGETCREKHCGGAGTSFPTCYYSMQPPKYHKHTHTHYRKSLKKVDNQSQEV